MKHLVIGLALFGSAQGFAAAKLSVSTQVYFRCASDSLAFSADCEMTPLSNGKFSLSLPDVEVAGLHDRCVITVVQGQDSFDLVPNTPVDEAVVHGRYYPTVTDATRQSFAVDFESAGSYDVYFDNATRTFFVAGRFDSLDL